MSNCLVITLKESVADSNLFRVGVADIRFQISSNAQRGLTIRLFEETKIETDSPVSIYDSSLNIEKSSVISATIPSGLHYVKPDSTGVDVTLSVFNKYSSIRRIGSSGGVWAENIKMLDSCNFLPVLEEVDLVGGDSLNFDLFANSPNLNTLYAKDLASLSGNLSSLAGKTFTDFHIEMASGVYGDAKGDISELTLPSGMTGFYMRRAGVGVTGDISSLGAFPLSSMIVAGTSIGGRLEDFCEEWYNRGVERVGIAGNKKISINGEFVSEGWSGFAKLEGGVLTIGDAIIDPIATYDGNSWTYA